MPKRNAPQALRPERLGRALADVSIEAKIGSKIDASAGPDGCWYYGSVRGRYASTEPFLDKDRKRTKVLVHRFTYEALVGPLAPGLDLHHRCENKACVNPRHLQPVTASEHMKIHAELRRTG